MKEVGRRGFLRLVGGAAAGMLGGCALGCGSAVEAKTISGPEPSPLPKPQKMATPDLPIETAGIFAIKELGSREPRPKNEYPPLEAATDQAGPMSAALK